MPVMMNQHIGTELELDSDPAQAERHPVVVEAVSTHAAGEIFLEAADMKDVFAANGSAEEQWPR